MPDDQVVTTPTEEPVDTPEPGQTDPTPVTTPPAAVSTPSATPTNAQPQTPASSPKPQRSDADARIAALMSEKDKVSHKNAELALEVVNLRKQLAELQKGQATAITEAGQKALTAIEESKGLRDQLDVANGQLKKLQILIDNPDLRDFASIIPATTDDEQLQATIETLKTARQKTLDGVREQIRTGTVPSSQPHRLGGKPTPDQIKEYLLEAKGNEVEYNRRLQEVLPLINANKP